MFETVVVDSEIPSPEDCVCLFVTIQRKGNIKRKDEGFLLQEGRGSEEKLCEDRRASCEGNGKALIHLLNSSSLALWKVRC